MTDVYTLALVAYAFELADDVAKEAVLNRLTVRAIREGMCHDHPQVLTKVPHWPCTILVYRRHDGGCLQLFVHVLCIICSQKIISFLIWDGTLHWEEEKSESHQGSAWRRPYYRPRSADIEITSYILLVYAHRRDVRTGLPIAQWLAQQRNSLGGYSSTQVRCTCRIEWNLYVIRE